MKDGGVAQRGRAPGSSPGGRWFNPSHRPFSFPRAAGLAVKNSIFVSKPYKWENMWVFDDANVGLVKEPFVGGADTIIDVATAHIPNAERGFIAVFSASYFPDAQIALEWVREDGGGNVYRWAEKGMEGWLCPALLKYFEQAPAKLHIQVKAAG